MSQVTVPKPPNPSPIIWKVVNAKNHLRKGPRKVLVKPWKVVPNADPRKDPRKDLANIKFFKLN
jgi:hypothetical protein